MHSDTAVTGPARSYNSRPGVGLHAPRALRIPAAAREQSIRELSGTAPEFQEIIGHRVSAGEELVLDLFPEAGPQLANRWDAGAAVIQLSFTDGTTLSGLGAADSYGLPLNAMAQAEGKRRYVDQWNRQLISLGPATGKEVADVLISNGAEHGQALWIDPPQIRPVRVRAEEPLHAVDTRRGSHSSDRFSRGNTAPLVGIPHGGVFALPMTDASAGNWPYAYHAHNVGQDNKTALQAFATSHIPSPWIGDRGVFQLMPSPLSHPDPQRSARALTFSHDAEQARAHEYTVRFDAGISAELTAADFALVLRLSGGVQSVIIDHLGRASEVEVDQDKHGVRLQALIQDRAGTLPHYICVYFPAGSSLTLGDDEQTRLRGYATLGAGQSDVVLVRVGISTLGAEQACQHARQASDYDSVRDAAARAWRERLGVLELEGVDAATEEALYSDLYRLFLYPNRHDEDTADGARRHRSPHDSAVREGPSSANNGFWDTYRTCWPAYAFLTPGTAASLANGFITQFQDSGWTSRWSAPGPVDCMTGTTTDTVFADLATASVPGLDLRGAYDSARINATVPANAAEVGRKGLAQSRYRGFTSTDTDEGMSWTLDNAINDFGAAVLGAALLEDRGAQELSAAERERVRGEVEYFTRRALDYRNVFNPEVGFFLGRTAAGQWRVSAGEFDPDIWGFDYTETNGWGTAFTAPHDGAGLARLHGGEAELGRKLDEFFARPETADESLCGSYGFVIHEQTEARDVRMGMFALSNQPAHHIPFMYCFAGRHDDAHRVIVEARERLFLGTEIGQGFPGDEDNGEMSGWHLFASLGFYPLAPASGQFILLPPAVPRAVLRPLGTDAQLLITATGAGKPYIASVTLDGKTWDSIDIPRALLARGGHLHFELADEPQGWAAASRPASLSGRTGHPLLADALPGMALPDEPWRDLLVVDPHGVTDDAGAAPLTLAAGQSVRLALTQSLSGPALYTLSLQDAQRAAWRLEGLNARGVWQLLDAREDEEFVRPAQLRPFRMGEPLNQGGPFSELRFTALNDAVVTQLEVLI